MKQTKKLKIAFFTETYLPNIDGVVVAIVTIRKELEKLGHQIWVLSSGDGRSKKENKDPKVSYYPSVTFAPYPQYKLAITTHGARNILNKNKIDIIHSHSMGPMGMGAIYCARMLGKPVIGTLHTNIQDATHYITSVKMAQEFMKKAIWRYLNLYYNQCDMTLAPSNTIGKLCKENGINNVAVIPTGIDIKVFKPAKSRKGKDGRINVLYVGRLVKEKNLDVVIKSALIVAEKIKNVHFTIIGVGPAIGYYENLAKQEGVDHLFTFIGLIEQQKELVKHYQEADIFAFPSIFETQGLSGMEAMACGLPVAGANYLAIPDFVKDGYNGYLFDPFDIDDCANKIIKTIEDRSKLRKGAIETGKIYSSKKCTAELLKIYYRALKENKGKKGIIDEITNIEESVKTVQKRIKDSGNKILTRLNQDYAERINILKKI